MPYFSDKKTDFHRKPLSPSTILVAGFAATIAIGTALLMLPMMSVGGGLGLLDSLFTATSAVCVMGLVVVDTGTHFTHAVVANVSDKKALLSLDIGGFDCVTVSLGEQVEASILVTQVLKNMAVERGRFL